MPAGAVAGRTHKFRQTLQHVAGMEIDVASILALGGR